MIRHAVRSLAVRYCCPLARFFRNPHHLSGVVFAMLLTNLATLFWAALVLLQQDALKRSNSRYAFVADYVHENAIAVAFGLIALGQLICLWTHRQPTRLRNAGYGLFSIAWSFVFFHSITQPGPVFPTSTSLSFAMAFAAFYAWLDGQTGERNAAPR